jgi:hypothetical protein
MNKQKQIVSLWIKFKEIDSHLNVILVNMCRYVEANYWDINFSKDNWYQTYKWCEENKDHFKKWLTDYIYGVKGAQRELFGRTTMRKKECEEAAAMFVFNYGWSSKDGE